MKTVQIVEFGIVNNKLKALNRHVYLVGENLRFEIEIKHFKHEPRCFALCESCAHGFIKESVPENCEDQKNMKTYSIICERGEDTLIDSSCKSFAPAV